MPALFAYGISKMKKLLLVSLVSLAVAGPVNAFGLNNLLSAGTDLVKSATLSDSEVQAMAAESSKVLDKQAKVAPAGSAYGKRLAKIVAGLNNEDGLKLNFKVYQDKEVNAFAMADGTVRVYSGAMQVAYAASAARKAAADSGNAKLAAFSESEMGDLAEQVLHAQFSQSQESDADAYAVDFLKRHNYKLDAAPAALRKLAALYGNDSSVLSSHPAAGDRADKVEKLIK